MKKIVITGANGLIGNSLSKFLENKNYQIVNLQRKNDHINNHNVKRWKLGDNLPSEILNADIFIHCAYDNSPNCLSKKFKENINYIGLKKILSKIRKKSAYEFYFLSSQSSKENSKSYYGRLKQNGTAIEI